MFEKQDTYLFRLGFVVLNIHREFLHFRLSKLTWELGDKRPKAHVEIEDDIAVLPPTEMYIQSPTLEDVPLGMHSGKFSLAIQFGRTQETMEYELSLFGTFRVLEVAPAPGMYFPDFRWNRIKSEVKEL